MSTDQTRTYDRDSSVVFLKTNEKFGGLSNMAGGYPLLVNGVRILTSEALYQACRFPHLPDVQKMIIGERSPMTAKMKSKPYRQDSRPDWDRVRVKIMRWCLRVKLAQNWRTFSELLLETGDRPIVEESRKDDFWGAYPNDGNVLVGKNVLGRLLMELRAAIKTQDQASLLRAESLDIGDFLLNGKPITAVSALDSGLSGRVTQASAYSSAKEVGGKELPQQSLFSASSVSDGPPPIYSVLSEAGVRIADLKQYSGYKESGHAWLGRVPIHWMVLPNRAVFSEVKDRNRPDEQMLSVTITRGIVPQKALLANSSKKDSSRQDKSAYKLVEPNDIAYNKMRAWQGAIGVSELRGIISPAYVVQRLRTDAHVPRYFHHLYRTTGFAKEAERWSYGITSDMWSLRPEHFKLIYTAVPPPDEQAAIVRFLDWANGRLERAIKAKRKVIALLNEQKQAIIHRAVTRGLDPSVPLKPSGIPWLGDIPEHWEVRRVKQSTRILRGKFSHRPRNDAALYDGRYPFIQTGAVAQASKFITTYSQTLNDKGLAVSKLFPAGTLVMTIAANIGDVAVLTFDACFPDSIVGFVPVAEAGRDYLYMVFLCMRPELLREAPVNTQGNLNVERIGSMGIPFPSRREQELIVSRVESETSAFDSGVSRLEREIELLREYRTRVVADVVTGKLDVREVATKIPDEVTPELIDEDTELTDDIEPSDEAAAA